MDDKDGDGFLRMIKLYKGTKNEKDDEAVPGMIKILMGVPRMIKMIRGAKNDKDDMG